MALLEIKNISIRFGGLTALDDMSLSMEPNTFVGLMGPNGAGKTTLINCISRINTPNEGRILFDGHDVLKLNGHEVIGLGISRTFQDLNFFNKIDTMSVLNYLKLGQFPMSSGNLLKDGFKISRTSGEEVELKRRAWRILEFFADVREKLEPDQEERGYPAVFGREGFPDLLDVSNQPLGNLSFAWRRRLDLARALVSNPRLLLLDEPMQGLPPSEIENLGKVLKMVQSEFNVSALIVEHNVGTLMAISDSIIAMNYGKKIAEGLPAAVRNNPEVIETYLGVKKETSKADVIPKLEVISSEVPIPSHSELPILQIKNIDLHYGHAQALFGVSLELYPNQVACVLGTNGSGKSTLLKVISGIERPSMGEIFFKGEFLPVGWPEAAVDRGIQYVPQGHVIFPRLTVKENMSVGSYTLQRRGLKPDYEKIFDYFPQLKDLGAKLAVDLSGGQQQMLAIAQALIAQPEVLLLDEPSLGLAPRLVELIFEIIKKISVNEKCSILLVEQSVAKSVEVSDFIYMMSAGVIVGKGSKKVFEKDDSVIRKNLGFY